MGAYLRFEPRDDDRWHVRRVVESTGFFYPSEVACAVELVDERLTKGPARGYEFVFAEYDGLVVGYACWGAIPLTVGSYDLYWIAVDRQRQGHGLGRRLLATAEEQIRLAGGRRIYIETSGREIYAPTRAFYLRCGYAAEAVLKDFYAEGDDKYIFSRAV